MKSKLRELPVIYVQCPLHSTPGNPSLAFCSWQAQNLIAICIDCRRLGQDLASRAGVKLEEEFRDATKEELRETIKHGVMPGQKHGLAPSPDVTGRNRASPGVELVAEPTLDDIRKAHDTRRSLPPDPVPPGPPPEI